MTIVKPNGNGKPIASKPDLSWAEIAALVFVLEHLKDRRLTKLGLQTSKVQAIRRAQKKMNEALEKYLESSK